MLYMTNERYESARKIYQSIGVDTEAALERLKNVPVSMHCWQQRKSVRWYTDYWKLSGKSSYS